MSKELLKRVIAECCDEGSRSNITTALYSAIIEYLEQPEPEPVAWMSADRDMTYINSYNGNDIPLYEVPPDQSARIVELTKQMTEIASAHTHLHRHLLIEHQALKQQLAALQAKREPLSSDEIRDCAESENLPYFDNKEEFDAFARAIEAAHGIGGK